MPSEEHFAKRLVDLEHIVRGVDGANGLRGKVADIAETVSGLDDRLRKMEMRIYFISALILGGSQVLDKLLG